MWDKKGVSNLFLESKIRDCFDRKMGRKTKIS